jgi:hypothetical protein
MEPSPSSVRSEEELEAMMFKAQLKGSESMLSDIPKIRNKVR